MINKQLRQPPDNPSIGIILCAAKDNVEVGFALMNIHQPIGVSEYIFSKVLPKKLEDKMSTARQLQEEVRVFYRNRNLKK